MNLIQLAVAIFETAESFGVEHMAVGAIAAGTYGIPRATKDIDDARDILAVQGTETLDMPYIENWCATHGTSVRLSEIIATLTEL